jgi:hypothetical protein
MDPVVFKAEHATVETTDLVPMMSIRVQMNTSKGVSFFQSSLFVSSCNFRSFFCVQDLGTPN